MKPKCALLRALVFAPPVYAADYWLTMGSRAASMMFTVADVESIVQAGDTRTLWLYLFGTENDVVDSVTGVRETYRCSAREKAVRQWVEYDPVTLAVLKAGVEESPRFESPIPETLPESSLGFVCTLRKDKANLADAASDFMHVDVADLRSLRQVVSGIAARIAEHRTTNEAR